MEIEIHTLAELSRSDSDLVIESAKSIFYETAPSIAHRSPEERAHFEYKYFGLYLSSRASFYFARSESGILGYLAGSQTTSPLHYELNPYLEDFRAEITSGFPAHLHINLSESARGLGIGTKLISRFNQDLIRSGSIGVHIITGVSARNAGFYRNNGFQEIKTAPPRLMMGKTLRTSSQ